MVLKKKDPFLELLYEIASNVHEAAQYFNRFKITSQESLITFSEKMKEYESKGDQYVHRIIHDLNKTFITSIEREDILNLAVTLDDVLDGMEACAARFFMYGITEPNEYMSKFGENIEASTQVILNAMDLLRNRKLLSIREYTVKINDLESVGDQLLRDGIHQLFKESTDPIHIIKTKEIYEILEKVSDSCEDVADTLETIIMRNS
jgi:predicted phosphate transport protein (TIGR00153 family)